MLIHFSLYSLFIQSICNLGFILVVPLRRIQIQNQIREIIILCRRDLLVFKDPLANKEKKEREGPGVSPVLLDHLDHLERE